MILHPWAVILLLAGCSSGVDARARGTRVHPSPRRVVAESPVWTVRGSLDGEGFAHAVVPVGDVDGDGYGDCAVGAYLTNGTLGRVEIYAGSATGLSASPFWYVDGADGAQLGVTLADGADVDGDGLNDIVAGTKYASSSAGAVLLYAGAAGAPTTSAVTLLSGEAAGDDLGWVVTTVDVDGDGIAEVATGAARHDAGAGRAYLFRDGTQEVLEWSDAPSSFGFATGNLGDLDGDGLPELGVGAPGGTDLPGFVVFSWPGGAAEPTILSTFIGDTEPFDGDLGCAFAAGDLDGDGHQDVAVGDSAADSVAVFFGAGDGSLVDPMAVLGDGSAFGYTLSAGDVDGDGVDELVIGEPGWQTSVDGAPVTTGRTHVVDARTGAAADGPFDGVDPDEGFGKALTLAADVNADGYADLLVGAPGADTDVGRLDTYLGAAAGLTADVSVAPGPAVAYEVVVPLGDLDGDGYADLAVADAGYAGAGRVWIYRGSPSGPTDWRTLDGQPGDAFGTAIAVHRGALVVGAPGAATVYTFPSIASGDTTPGATLVGATADAFGTALAVGDTDGDGADELAVGAPGGQRVDVYTDLVSPPVPVSGDASGFGTTVALGPFGLAVGAPDANDGAGDVSTFSWSSGAFLLSSHLIGTAGEAAGAALAPLGDDLLVGAPGHDSARGRVQAFATGDLTAASAEVAGTATGDRFGASIATLGDINGDGIDEIAAGAPDAAGHAGEIQVFAGAEHGLGPSPTAVVTGAVGERLGTAVAGVGDVDGDGRSDLAGLADGGASALSRVSVWLGLADDEPTDTGGTADDTAPDDSPTDSAPSDSPPDSGPAATDTAGSDNPAMSPDTGKAGTGDACGCTTSPSALSLAPLLLIALAARRRR